MAPSITSWWRASRGGRTARSRGRTRRTRRRRRSPAAAAAPLRRRLPEPLPLRGGEAATRARERRHARKKQRARRWRLRVQPLHGVPRCRTGTSMRMMPEGDAGGGGLQRRHRRPELPHGVPAAPAAGNARVSAPPPPPPPPPPRRTHSSTASTTAAAPIFPPIPSKSQEMRHRSAPGGSRSKKKPWERESVRTSLADGSGRRPEERRDGDEDDGDSVRGGGGGAIGWFARSLSGVRREEEEEGEWEWGEGCPTRARRSSRREGKREEIRGDSLYFSGG